MTNFIVPVMSLLLTFLSMLSTGRQIFSRKGFYWIIPFLFSLLFSYSNLETLLGVAEGGEAFVISISSLLPLLASILWYAMVVTFHYALKEDRNYNDNYVNESRRNYQEAVFVEKFERRKATRRQQEKAEEQRNKPKSAQVPAYRSFPDFDD